MTKIFDYVGARIGIVWDVPFYCSSAPSPRAFLPDEPSGEKKHHRLHITPVVSKHSSITTHLVLCGELQQGSIQSDLLGDAGPATHSIGLCGLQNGL